MLALLLSWIRLLQFKFLSWSWHFDWYAYNLFGDNILSVLLLLLWYIERNRDIVSTIATGYGLDGQGVWIRVPVESMSSRPVLGPTQPPIQWVPEALSPGVKRPGRETEHSPPTSAKVKKTLI
jgi:hypothetical protein